MRHCTLARRLRRVAPAALAAFFGALCAGAGSARAEIIEIDPGGDLIAAIDALLPGDELVLAGGTYNLNSLFTIAVSGTAAMPIVIRAKDGEVPIITRPDANQNTINITGSYLTLRGLEVMGGSHGIRLNNCSFVTIEECNVHSTGDVAISANIGGSSYQGLIFRRNHVHDTGGTGEGFYLGCNDNACQMFDSLLEGNYVHDTVNGTDQGDGIEIKLGSYNNVVRDNVIHDTRYPCILVYGAAGNGGPNVIERNAMWGCGDHAIQAASDAIIRNNIILGAAADGIRSQPHQGAEPQNLVIVHNTVINDGDALRADGVVGSLLVANNALYSQNGSALRVGGDLGAVVSLGNFGSGALQGVTGFDGGGNIAADFLGADFSGVPGDVFPAAGSGLIGAGAVEHVTADDFNGTPRGGVADVGAYRFDAAGNPGWTVGPGFKADVPGTGGAGGGGGAGAGGPGSGGAGTGTGNGTGNGSGGAASSGEPPSSEESDCGCRLPGTGRGHSPAGILGLGLALVGWGIRRRRRASPPSTGGAAPPERRRVQPSGPNTGAGAETGANE